MSGVEPTPDTPAQRTVIREIRYHTALAPRWLGSRPLDSRFRPRAEALSNRLIRSPRPISSESDSPGSPQRLGDFRVNKAEALEQFEARPPVARSGRIRRSQRPGRSTAGTGGGRPPARGRGRGVGRTGLPERASLPPGGGTPRPGSSTTRSPPPSCNSSPEHVSSPGCCASDPSYAGWPGGYCWIRA